MPNAAPSTRSSGNVTLSFGLVNIPITLYAGIVSDHGLERHEYLPVKTGTKKVKVDDVESPDFGKEIEVDVIEDHRIGRGNTDKTTGELLTPDERAQVQKKIETEYGPVFVEDHEIEKFMNLDPDTLKILEFQPHHLFHQGHYVPKGLQYIEPSKTGSGAKKQHMPMAVKLLGTLLKGMREEGVIAVGELTTRGVPKPCILTADGVLWLVHHTDAVRSPRELPEANLVDAEVQMMRGLIAQLTKTVPADLSDVRSELIQGYADEKAAAGDFGKTADTYSAPAQAEPSLDLMAMLQASVDAARAS